MLASIVMMIIDGMRVSPNTGFNSIMRKPMKAYKPRGKR
jgi:hypothetical protein